MEIKTLYDATIQYPDPIRIQALEYALKFKHYNDRLEVVIEAAKEFEKFLRGDLPT